MQLSLVPARVVLVYLGCVAFAFQGVARAEDLFPDKDLEDVVRQYVFEKRNNKEPLTAKDVENISTIKGRGRKITNLKGLEECRSLAQLDLGDNAISDLGPIKELQNLQSLTLSNNKLTDISALEGLTNLQYLHLAENRVTDLKPLAKLENLRSLYLEHNQIQDLAPLAGLVKLWSLYLNGNAVKDLKPLEKLTRLSSLDLRDNQVADLAPLAGYTELRYLLLDDNQIADAGVLVEMAKKDNEGEKRFAPFWNVYLARNPVVKDKADQLEELKKLGCRLMLGEQ